LLDLIINNKEWIFSGIGVPVVVGLIVWARRTLFYNSKEDAVPPRVEVEAGPRDAEVLIEPTECEKIAERFRQVLELFNEGCQYKLFNIAKLAQILNLNKVSELENVFIGREEPTFVFIEHFCETFGVSKEWLLEGKGAPFLSKGTGRGDPLGYYEDIHKIKPEGVYFIRSSSDVGEMFLILKHTNWKFTVLNRIFHVSDCVGTGGQLQLVSLFHLINKLRDSRVRCCGRTLDPKLFSALQSGNAFPGKVIDVAMSDDPWWDDFTDIEHKYPIAENYRQWHGEPFIKAQEIVKWGLGLNSAA
jgi:hypothetical protein